MKKRHTLADLAAVAGVSLMTVSRAVNGKPGVGEELRQRIMQLAEEMEYQPNQLARGLATNRSATIGLVVPDNTNPFFAHIARGVEDIAYQHDYNIFLVNTAEDPVRERAALDSLWQKGVDGLVLCSSRLPEDVLEAEISRFPAVVLLNRELGKPLPHLITITINDEGGAKLAVKHFLDQGRRHIAYLNGLATSYSARRRLEGYRLALEDAEISFDPSLVECCAPDTDGGRSAAAAVLARRSDVDAIYAYNDLVAVGALQVVTEAGKKVPGDIAIIGVDDIPLASIIRPRLTTLHVNMTRIGRLAMQTLLDTVENDKPSTQISIDPELYVRESA